MVQGGGGDEVGTSINFNFSAWYEVEIRFSDNPRQGDIILAQENKACNLQIRYHF